MPNTYAIYFNPAALGGSTGTTITGDVSLLLRWAQYRRVGTGAEDALSPSDPASKNNEQYVGSNTGKGNLLNLLALPFAGVNTDFGGNKILRGGYAVYIPFGGLATWDRNDNPVFGVPGTVDRAQRWHNISGQILAIYNTFALAFKVHPRFTIGLNASPVLHMVKTVRARNADGSDDTVVNGNLVEGRSLLSAHGFNMAVGAGVYWEATDNFRLGASYTSQPGFGETKMTGELTTQIAATPPGGAKDINFYQTYPDVIRFGAAGKIGEKWELRGDFEFVRWSVFDRQCVTEKGIACNVAADGRDLSGGKVILNIPRNWNDAIGLRVGPGYQLNDDVELFGSLGFTTPAVPDKTMDASTIDAFRLYATAGGKFALSKKMALATSYNHIFFFDRTITQSGQNIPDHPATSPGGGDYNVSRSPSANGRYRSQIGFVNINVAYTF